FGGNTRYTLTLTLNAAANHTFLRPGVTATVNGATATVASNNGSRVILSFQFPATAADPPPQLITIDTVALDIAAPVAGEARLPVTVTGAQFNYTITWSSSDEFFREGVRYTATITLTANAGFTFLRPGVTATVNGANATVASNNGTRVILSFQFPAVPPPPGD
ncbi:MAG: hypothetical protein FWE59_07100, partial [Oscillospiraceae bacterium]|nr:hypothetical protein [Oscillospiraceae bacterium]